MVSEAWWPQSSQSGVRVHGVVSELTEWCLRTVVRAGGAPVLLSPQVVVGISFGRGHTTPLAGATQLLSPPGTGVHAFLIKIFDCATRARQRTRGIEHRLDMRKVWWHGRPNYIVGHRHQMPHAWAPAKEHSFCQQSLYLKTKIYRFDMGTMR